MLYFVVMILTSVSQPVDGRQPDLILVEIHAQIVNQNYIKVKHGTIPKNKIVFLD
jgi:hypothetical protein